MGGVLVLAAVAGLLARRRFALGAALLVVLVAVAAFTALNRPTAEPRDVLPSLATAVAGRRRPVAAGPRPGDRQAAAAASADYEPTWSSAPPRPAAGVLIARRGARRGRRRSWAAPAAGSAPTAPG